MQVQKNRYHKKWQMWHPIIPFLFSSLEPRWHVGVTFLDQRAPLVGLVLKRRQSRSRTTGNPAKDHLFLETHPFLSFFVSSHVSGKVKENIWGQKKVIFHQISWSVGELESVRVVQLEAGGCCSSAPTNRCCCTAEQVRSRELAHCCSQTRRSRLLESAAGKQNQIIIRSRREHAHLFSK